MATVYCTYEARYDKAAAADPNGLVAGQGFTVVNRMRWVDPFGTMFWTIAIEAPVSAAAKGAIAAALGGANGAVDVVWYDTAEEVPASRRLA